MPNWAGFANIWYQTYLRQCITGTPLVLVCILLAVWYHPSSTLAGQSSHVRQLRLHRMDPKRREEHEESDSSFCPESVCQIQLEIVRASPHGQLFCGHSVETDELFIPVNLVRRTVEQLFLCPSACSSQNSGHFPASDQSPPHQQLLVALSPSVKVFALSELWILCSVSSIGSGWIARGSL